MDIKRSRLYLLAVIFLFILTGCSHSHNPVTANEANDTDAIETPVAQTPSMPVDRGNRVLWGYWDVRIEPDDLTIEAVPDRASAMHFNVVRLIEVTPCPYCLKIENIQWLAGNIVEADLRLQHPFPGMAKFTGFDVRGIFISEADYLFPETDRRIAYGNDVPRLLNPDGFTSLFNPTEFPEGSAPFPILGYITGKYSTGGPLSTTLNPYVAYGTENPRRLFEAGSAEARRVRIQYSSLPIQFGYAVDASWFPAGDVIDPVTDFPPEANCMEAYKIAVHGYDVIRLTSGGIVEATLEIFDHQGLETISTVTVEAPEIFNGVVDFQYISPGGTDSWLFNGIIRDDCGLLKRDYPLIVRVADTDEDQNLGTVDAWDVLTVRIEGDYDGGWARTWGGEGYVTADIAVDNDGNMYLVGAFKGTAEFNPCGGAQRTSVGESDAYISSFDSSGRFRWVRTWGSADSDWLGAATADDSGNIYAIGGFNGTVNLNPDGSEMYTSNGDGDPCIIKYDSNGNFLWARVWGGIDRDDASDISYCETGNFYISGNFKEQIDLKPGGGDPHTSSGKIDAYLAKYDSDGNFIWGRTWGGGADDLNMCVACDDSENSYAYGRFFIWTDLDPDGGDVRSSNGFHDVFLSRFDSEGNYMWGRTWGNEGSECIEEMDLAVDYDGNAYVIGGYEGPIDLDPDGGDPHGWAGQSDIFFCKYKPDGRYIWGQVWGAQGSENANAIAINDSGNIFITGSFSHHMDFDPDWDDSEMRDPVVSGNQSAYLSVFDNNGDFLWVRIWGGYDEHTKGYFIGTDGFDNVYIGGYFSGTANFAPIDEPCFDDPDYHTAVIGMGDSDIFLTKYLPDGCW